MLHGLYIPFVTRAKNEIYIGTNAGIWKLRSINDVPCKLKGIYQLDLECLVTIPALREIQFSV